MARSAAAQADLRAAVLAVRKYGCAPPTHLGLLATPIGPFVTLAMRLAGPATMPQ
jgi:hypothetical protein